MKLDKLMEKLWNERIPYIKTMKDFYLNMNYHGLNLWPIMANDVYTYYRNQEHRTKKERFSFIIKSFFIKDNFPILGKEKGILASYFWNRKDHLELFNKSIEAFSKKELILIDCFEYKNKKSILKYSLNFPNIFLIIKLMRLFKKNKLKKILNKNYHFFIARTYLRHQEIRQFENILNKFNPRAYIAFCSQASEGDAILTLLAKKRNIPSFTLQHGLIVDYPNFQPMELLKENLISDYNLIWGNTTYKTLKTYAPSSQFIIVGNPKYSEIFENKKDSFNPKKCVIFFPVPTDDASTNENMAKIINQFAKKHLDIIFEPSVHPFDNLENYKKLMDAKNIHFVSSDIPIQKRIEESDFIILHNTTIAMEALRYGNPILRFEDKNLISLWDNEDTFKNEENLEEAFTNLRNQQTFQKWKMFYQNEFKNNFYLSGKPTSQYYKEIIMSKIK